MTPCDVKALSALRPAPANDSTMTFFSGGRDSSIAIARSASSESLCAMAYAYWRGTTALIISPFIEVRLIGELVLAEVGPKL